MHSIPDNNSAHVIPSQAKDRCSVQPALARKTQSPINAFRAPKKTSSSLVFQSTFAHSSDDTLPNSTYIDEVHPTIQLTH